MGVIWIKIWLRKSMSFWILDIFLMNYDKKDLKLRVAPPILLKNVPFVFLILKENLDQHGAEELKIVFFGVSYHTNPFKTFLICNI